MTCSSCEAKVKSALLSIENISKVEVSKETNSASITMDKHVSLSTLRKKLDKKYIISANDHSEMAMQTQTWFETYKPILLIFGYITFITLIIQIQKDNFDRMQWMQHFMAGFFLTFSFFKLLNLKGFAESYVMYDVIARKIPIWAYLYPFIELALGFAFLIGFYPILTNTITFFVMSVSIIGVLQSVLNKKKIQCACLGAIFNLPMSKVTIIEDALMIVMSAYMIIQYL
jgi:cation transport ATPase